MKIRKLNSFLVNHRIPLEYVLPDERFVLLKVNEIREFKDNKFTDRVIGFSYQCVESHDFKRFTVKIEGQTEPLISNSDLQEQRNQGNQVYVKFQNATILAYASERTESLEDSLKADDIILDPSSTINL